LTTQLSDINSLGSAERQALLDATRRVLLDGSSRRLTRLLLVELHAAKLAGSLLADDSAGRWHEFVTRACEPSFWAETYEHYLGLRARLDSLIGNRCAAALELAHRFGADRPAIRRLLAGSDAELLEVAFGLGDSHRGGRTVALLGTSSGVVVYKPRSLEIDRQLGRLLGVLLEPVAAEHPIRVPRVVSRAGYGWAEHIEHRYCTSTEELDTYYTGLGHWLAVAKLLDATDLHAENLIAHGPTPIVIDCEALFGITAKAPASGYGQAVDQAAEMLKGTVLQSGLLPGRGVALGWRGVDVSAAGALPGQQPLGEVARLIDAGTDRARLGRGVAAPLQAANQPSPEPRLSQHWHRVLAGFEELTARLIELDLPGDLARLLRPFRMVETRAVLRATESYAELARMLWHPASLHDEPTTIRRAADLLVRQGEISPPAPTDPAVVGAEIAELLVGDVPVFHLRPGEGRLSGPGGSTWGDRLDLVADALQRWRTADLGLEREVIRSTLISAYRNEEWKEHGVLLQVTRTPIDGADRRRQELAASLVVRLIETAINGRDGTVSWIAPTLSVTGWGVHPLNADLYAGSSGIAVLLAGYLREASAGRAQPVAGAAELLDRVVHGMQLADRLHIRQDSDRFHTRPESPGLYAGLGSRIWAWLQLAQLGAVGNEGLSSATELAGLLVRSVDEHTEPDLLLGRAGSIVALLRLAAAGGDQRWLRLAESVGERLLADGYRTAGTLCWRSARAPAGMGGFAHGATGIGWALARLARTSGRDDFGAAADAAFAFEESLWQPATGSWLDARRLDTGGVTTGWCHGSTGIGLASLDLLDRSGTVATDHASVVRRAAAASWRHGMGHNHSLCHGDLGCWELLVGACRAGLGPPGVQAVDIDGYLLASLEQHGPVTGAGRDIFSPGLVPGLAGLAYQLLRMHPDCGLPSVLLPD
jgi:type 2 lantibiotic biosynthesis protein LanM